MARQIALLCLGATLLRLSSGLQVTPNSPCASFCLDEADGDESDPSLSNTTGRDIACHDDEFGGSIEGQKFQRCLSCLQDSTFEQGSESDQDWFLYNLRYSFDYCVFGYPNATDVASGPCITSEACGGLENALKEGILDPGQREQYDYCDADGRSMLGDSFEKCHACVRADHTFVYVSNFLVALEAGCQQKSPPNVAIGLNDTVFSKTTIEIVDPTVLSDTDSEGTRLSTPAIVGISIAALAVVLLAAGCVYMQRRKRKNRAQRVRASEWSFRCQTHLTPRTAAFAREDDGVETEQKTYREMSGLRTSPKLASITTSLPCPPPAHSSPRGFSPDDYTTPTSTTSTRSNAPLLHHRPYNPTEHAVSPPLASPPLFSPGLSISGPRPTSPMLTNRPLPHEPKNHESSQWEEQRLAGSGRDLVSKKKRAPRGTTTPVEVTSIQTTFAPPPKKAF